MLARIFTVTLALFSACSILMSAAAQGAALSYVVSLPVRPGVTVRYLVVGKAAPKPRIAVILFAGGDGFLNLGLNGTIGTNLAQNFLVRSRFRFANQGFFVAVVDTPGQVTINGNVRLSAQYAGDIAKVIGDVRTRAQAAKVWLIGTSAGTLSAVGVASQSPIILQPPPFITKINLRRPNGIVLTSTQSTLVTGLCGRTVFNATLSAINVPAYVVGHKADGCGCSPASAAPSVLAALTGSPAKGRVEFTGGDDPISKDPCQAQTPHGFLGIEDSVVNAISGWIKTH